MELAETQRLFWEVVAQRKEANRSELERVFVGTPELSVVDRLEIYGSMYIHRLVEALAAEFPVVAERLGEDAFFTTAEAYMRKHPSEHPSIAHLGKHLPRYLRALGRRDLADIATLERARSLIFEAVDETPLAADALGTVPPEALGDARLTPVKALALVRLTAVYRRGFVVHEVKLSRLESRAVKLLLRDATLGEICEVFAGEPEPVVAAFQVVGRWFASCWIARIA